MRNHIQSIVTAALALTVICAVVVAALAATNMLTADTIAAAELEATNDACRTVLPAADSFERMDREWANGVEEVYKATSSGNTVGYVVKTVTVGKSSGLTVMTGVTADGVVSGVQIIADSETAGYVDTVTKGGLLDRLLGISEEAMAVDGVSQATKTSNGVKSGVALALAVYEEVNGNG